jgi:hypothetical protein
MAARKRPVTKRSPRPGDREFRQLVAECMAAGQRRKEAEAHARKILAMYDVFEVDERTGRWRRSTGGPSILDLLKRLD